MVLARTLRREKRLTRGFSVLTEATESGSSFPFGRDHRGIDGGFSQTHCYDEGCDLLQDDCIKSYLMWKYGTSHLTEFIIHTPYGCTYLQHFTPNVMRSNLQDLG
ncbi:uncharacterized protein LOC143184143 [Calliopsis andreniformis]|uniref:uncharacterized protein LOC143184143 n=1 Tax=Calliopsis andreniformis TaxID=337506 RepID=UPI003FCE984B